MLFNLVVSLKHVMSCGMLEVKSGQKHYFLYGLNRKVSQTVETKGVEFSTVVFP